MRYKEIVSEIEQMDGPWDGILGRYERYVDDAKPFATIGGYKVTKTVDRKLTALIFYEGKNVIGFVMLSDESNVLPNAVDIEIAFDTPYQRQGLGMATYKFLLDHGYVIVSGYNQYPGAIAIWKKLMVDPSVKVAVFYPKDINSANSQYIMRKPKTPDEPWTTKNEYMRLIVTKK